MKIKTVTRTISENKQQNGAFAIAFGDRTLFDILKIELKWQGTNKVVTYEIESQFLPYNKGNATRFRIVEGELRWCSKVASNMKLR
ncbi:MAG: hypothetical protein R3Y38_02915 [Rikenellaceae bacterium]